MRSTLRVIDFISEWSGRTIKWLCVAVVLVLCYEVALRYIFGAPTIWVFIVSRMLGCSIVILGAAYTLRENKHVRVDVFYSRLPPKAKATVDMICALIFFFPLMYVLIRTSADYMLFSLSMGQVIKWTPWYPPFAPLRAVILLGFCLLTLQGVAQFIRDSNLVIRNKTYD
ncbi:MAG: TRAP transporter small permease subunit [Dehalococcoidia bacterium]|nr:MAG: TRAP transporter small permease subunit [Dehalococcoidia bacterium]